MKKNSKKSVLEKFLEEIDKKTSWGRNELKELLLRLLVESEK
jgi:hypothetical protein